MKRRFLLLVLGAFLCFFLTGCHTARMLSRVDTGRVGFGDIWDSMLLDDLAFQEHYW